MTKTIAVAALLAAASSALASQVLMTNPGGAYHAELVSGYVGEGGASPGFDTFCIEENEFFYPPEVMISSISNQAVSGGVGGPHPDPISERTALMYWTYRTGGSFGGSGVVSMSDDGEQNSLQRAVWASEDEISYSDLAGYEKDLYDWAEANAVSGEFHHVAVLNTRHAWDGTNGQDFLTIVPLPSAAWAGMGSLALVLGTGYVRRRNQQA
jgi:hypothetical protein